MSATKKNITRCVNMTGPDDHMDVVGDSYFNLANPLPIKCAHCTFPDLNFVARPYLLAKGISVPAETSPANMANFLVRERVRRILEVVVPAACTFHPTAERKSKKTAPWWLVEPKQMLHTPVPKPTPPFCSKCREPKEWSYPAAKVWEKMNHYDTRGVDVFKSIGWWSGETVEDDYAETNRYRKKSGEPALPWSHWGVEEPPHPQRWTRTRLDRELYFSVRLEQLFKRAQVKGQLVRSFSFKEVEASADDEAWIEAKLMLLAELGLLAGAKDAKGKRSNAVERWFQQFLKRNARKGRKSVDVTALEKKHKIRLPKDYKDFVSIVGPKSFEGINETEGFSANILPPEKLDFKDYRRGRIPYLEGEQAKVDGVMFASTDHGDCFVFDVSSKDKDHAVFWYDHEQNALEPFAATFAECIKRFADRN